MLGQGRGGCTVVQILTLIQKSHVKKTKQSTCILNSVPTVHVSSETFALVVNIKQMHQLIQVQMCNAPRKFFIPLSVELDIVGIFSLFWPMDNGLLEASKKIRC